MLVKGRVVRRSVTIAGLDLGDGRPLDQAKLGRRPVLAIMRSPADRRLRRPPTSGATSSPGPKLRPRDRREAIVRLSSRPFAGATPPVSRSQRRRRREAGPHAARSTLASIVEKRPRSSGAALIAAVYANRVRRHRPGSRPDGDLRPEEDRARNSNLTRRPPDGQPYNTYRYAGLPRPHLLARGASLKAAARQGPLPLLRQPQRRQRLRRGLDEPTGTSRSGRGSTGGTKERERAAAYVFVDSSRRVVYQARYVKRTSSCAKHR
jgi:hypothetical protein